MFFPAHQRFNHIKSSVLSTIIPSTKNSHMFCIPYCSSYSNNYGSCHHSLTSSFSSLSNHTHNNNNNNNDYNDNNNHHRNLNLYFQPSIDSELNVFGEHTTDHHNNHNNNNGNGNRNGALNTDSNDHNLKKSFVDKIRILCRGGNGGSGGISFEENHRKKGKPDGGNGGHGGSVILETSSKTVGGFNFATRHFQGTHGEKGEKCKKNGKNGSDIVIQLPLGTVISQIGVFRRAETKSTLVHNRSASVICDDGMSTGTANSFTDVDMLSEFHKQNTFDRNACSSEAGVLFELLDINDSIVIANGGRGGHGNMAFKTKQNTHPRWSESGQPGEEVLIELELKSIADVGLVGYPNAGKSTLLSAISRAKPAISSLPFTTLNPHIGYVYLPTHDSHAHDSYDGSDGHECADGNVNDNENDIHMDMDMGVEMELDLNEQRQRRSHGGKYKKARECLMQRMSVADIPGIIAGASMNQGLGLEFLRHIERCQVLVFVLDIIGCDGRCPVKDFVHLFYELQCYNESATPRTTMTMSMSTILQSKPMLIFANKCDLVHDPQLLTGMEMGLGLGLGLETHGGGSGGGDGLQLIVNARIQKLKEITDNKIPIVCGSGLTKNVSDLLMLCKSYLSSSAANDHGVNGKDSIANKNDTAHQQRDLMNDSAINFVTNTSSTDNGGDSTADENDSSNNVLDEAVDADLSWGRVEWIGDKKGDDDDDSITKNTFYYTSNHTPNKQFYEHIQDRNEIEFEQMFQRQTSAASAAINVEALDEKTVQVRNAFRRRCDLQNLGKTVAENNNTNDDWRQSGGGDENNNNDNYNNDCNKHNNNDNTINRMGLLSKLK